MPVIKPDYIRCSFDTCPETEAALSTGRLDIFFATNEDLRAIFPYLENLISDDERKRADKFISDNIRETYIMSHATLRICLSEYLGSSPGEIMFRTTENSKPFIVGDTVCFNLSHTNGAFVIAVSKEAYVGVDIEAITLMPDIRSIAKSFFSRKEQNFIFSSENDIEERFFLLWTRKESFLKAIGTGMIDHLDQVEVSGNCNLIDREIFKSLVTCHVSGYHYIYSMKMFNYCISATAPLMPVIELHHIHSTDLTRNSK